MTIDTSPNALKILEDAVAAKEREISELRAAIGAIYRERRKTCTHPNEESDMSAFWCPDCGWHKDRSF